MKIREYILSIFLIIFFIAPFFLINDLTNVLFGYVNNNYLLSSVVYVLLLVVSIVVAPISTPVFLVAGGMFPPAVTAMYNIIGWGVGAIIAFLIARYLGKPILAKFISLSRIEKYAKWSMGEKLMPKKLEFWWIVLLRVVTPVDFLSYALGLFSSVSFSTYSIATIIGIVPFSIIFAYGGNAIFEGNYFIFSVLVILVILSFTAGVYMVKKHK